VLATDSQALAFKLPGGFAGGPGIVWTKKLEPTVGDLHTVVMQGAYRAIGQ